MRHRTSVFVYPSDEYRGHELERQIDRPGAARIGWQVSNLVLSQSLDSPT